MGLLSKELQGIKRQFLPVILVVILGQFWDTANEFEQC
jgi:hypothetical protein